MQKFRAHLPLGCFQNLFSLISSAAPVASFSSSASYNSLARTFKVDGKRERENDRETLMKGTTK